MRRPVHIHFHTRDAEKWDESKHPRASNGRFGSGRPSGKEYGPETLARVKRRLSIHPGAEVPTHQFFSHMPVDLETLPQIKGQLKKVEGRELVNLEELIPTQATVTKKGLLLYAANKGNVGASGSIKVIEKQGKLYLLDGHHRVSVMRIAGIGKADIDVMRERKK